MDDDDEPKKPSWRRRIATGVFLLLGLLVLLERLAGLNPGRF
jgi:hypothetical protein